MKGLGWLVVACLSTACAACRAEPAVAGQLHECERQADDSHFDFHVARKSAGGSPTNQGIVPTGFVAVRGTITTDGVDVSKYQDSADFRRVRDCGGTFAYVRMSFGTFPDNELEYRVHWANARAVGLMTGGYHFLKVPALSLRPDDIRSADMQKLEKEATASAHAQAELYLSRMDEVLSLDEQNKAKPGQLGQLVLPLTLSAGLTASFANLTSADLARYGQLYRAEICEWINTVRANPAYSGHPIMIFTYPHIYLDYDFDAAKCGVSSMMLWIGYLGLQGGRSPPEDDDQWPAWNRVCLRSSADRCRFQLYTSYGSFLDFKGQPAVDLDRFYGSKADLERLLTAVPKH